MILERLVKLVGISSENEQAREVALIADATGRDHNGYSSPVSSYLEPIALTDRHLKDKLKLFMSILTHTSISIYRFISWNFPCHETINSDML